MYFSPPVEMSSDRRPDDCPLRLPRFHLVFPLGHLCLPGGMLVLEPCFEFPGLAENLLLLDLLLRRIDGDIGIIRVIDEREHAVIVCLLQRIVFVIVALGALDGDAQNAFADGVHAVVHGLHAELLGIDSTLFVNHGIAQEAGGYNVVLGGVGQQVTGDLIDHELVVRQVAVEGS